MNQKREKCCLTSHIIYMCAYRYTINLYVKWTSMCRPLYLYKTFANCVCLYVCVSVMSMVLLCLWVLSLNDSDATVSLPRRSRRIESSFRYYACLRYSAENNISLTYPGSIACCLISMWIYCFLDFRPIHNVQSVSDLFDNFCFIHNYFSLFSNDD